MLPSERPQVGRRDPNRVADADVAQLAAVDELVHARGADAEDLGHLAHAEQPLHPDPWTSARLARGWHKPFEVAYYALGNLDSAAPLAASISNSFRSIRITWTHRLPDSEAEGQRFESSSAHQLK